MKDTQFDVRGPLVHEGLCPVLRTSISGLARYVELKVWQQGHESLF